MDERARALLAGKNFATVSMGRKDGSVFSVYTWIDIEGDRITLNTSQGRVWPKIIERDPRVTETQLEGAHDTSTSSATSTTATTTTAGSPARSASSSTSRPST